MREVSLTAAWTQELPSPENDLAGWEFWCVYGGKSMKVSEIPFTEEKAEYSAEINFPVPDGSITEYKFLMRAYDKLDNLSSWSNPVYLTIENEPPQSPRDLTVALKT